MLPPTFTQTFTVSGCSLKLLKPGEKGVITRFQPTNDLTTRKLSEMGIRPGATITLEKRFPAYLIKVGAACFRLDESMMNAIYVRIVNSPLKKTSRFS
ncbi:MAG: ferrous iron transport protein A [Oculatellaceae cyanobacterium Prado106]|jgi:ferrous iron transport protein A|nr:ferrous iron transport protein A [Oculatellaceae cyanobacterium Prado106]